MTKRLYLYPAGQKARNLPVSQSVSQSVLTHLKKSYFSPPVIASQSRSNLSYLFSFLFGVIFSLTLLAGCDGGGGGGGGGGGTPTTTSGGSDTGTKDTTPPSFDGIILSYSKTLSNISIHWAEASDDQASPDKIKYNIYINTSSDINSIIQNKVAVLTNQTTNYSDNNFASGTTYYCLVEAEDLEGNKSLNNKIAQVTVLQSEPKIESMPKEIKDMAVSTTVNSDNSITLTGTDASSIMENDIIIIETGGDSQTLKKVIFASQTTDGVKVTTEDASLNQIIKSGTLNSNVTLTSLEDLPSSKVISKSKSSEYTYNDPAGFFKITETYAPATKKKFFKPSQKAKFAKYKSVTDLDASASLSDEITLGYSIGFEPGFYTEAEFDDGYIYDSLKRVKISALGKLSLEAFASYVLKGSANFEVTKRLTGMDERELESN